MIQTTEASVGRYMNSAGQKGVSITFPDKPTIIVEMTPTEMLNLATDLLVEARKGLS